MHTYPSPLQLMVYCTQTYPVRIMISDSQNFQDQQTPYSEPPPSGFFYSLKNPSFWSRSHRYPIHQPHFFEVIISLGSNQALHLQSVFNPFYPVIKYFMAFNWENQINCFTCLSPEIFSLCSSQPHSLWHLVLPQGFKIIWKLSLSKAIISLFSSMPVWSASIL